MSLPANTVDGERFRPQWHYSPRRNWMNDPNGLIWFDGEYHLFYQYNPFGDTWGHMSWGHAVSTDLVHWLELPVAIPEDERVSIFSGSVVLDTHNTSGFAAPGEVPLVAIYTGCRRVPEGGQAQELAWSVDRGRTWQKFDGNPVLDPGLRDFRDPKVFWHAGTARWVMAVVRPNERQVSFFASTNLREWSHLSDFGPAGETGGIWECPDLIHFKTHAEHSACWMLKVDTFAGHPGGSGAQVFFGQFDGTRFTAFPDVNSAGRGNWVDHGADFYAALSWANLPPHHTAPVWVGWMNNHAYAKDTPTAPWRGAMSVPRELFIRRSADGLKLGQRPWSGLQALRGRECVRQTLTLCNESRPLQLSGSDPRSLELLWQIEAADATEFGLRLREGSGGALVVGVDTVRQVLFVDRENAGRKVDSQYWTGRREAPLSNGTGPLGLRVLLDRCSVEVFTEDGSACLTELVFAEDDAVGVSLFAQGGGVVRSVVLGWELRVR